jgi:class 3 adenylate cyclase
MVPFLAYRDDEGTYHVHALEESGTVTIGRGREVDISLPWDRSVSLLHAEAVRLGSHWLISDDGVSRNGTFVNGERVAGRRRLRHGDVMRVGHTELSFDDASSGRRGSTTIGDPATATGTATLLFTDLVSSTELIDRVGDDAGGRLMNEHFAILRRAVMENGGEEVKSLGDGLMLAFSSAIGAVACAVAMQRRLTAHGRDVGIRAMGLRIGLNAGEVIRADGDYFGRPVVVAKRLCDQAGSGQIVLSEIVRSLVGSRGDYRFKALGRLQLKGLADPVNAFGLEWRV